MTISTDTEFVLLVDRTTQALAFAQGFAACMAAMLVTPAAQPTYQPTEKSTALTRQALGSMGVSAPGPRSVRLSASERRNAEAKANAARWGFPVSRVGGAA